MKKAIKIKAIDRETIIKADKKTQIKEKQIEISVFPDEIKNNNDFIISRQTLLDEKGREYEIVHEIIPIIKELNIKTKNFEVYVQLFENNDFYECLSNAKNANDLLWQFEHSVDVGIITLKNCIKNEECKVDLNPHYLYCEFLKWLENDLKGEFEYIHPVECQDYITINSVTNDKFKIDTSTSSFEVSKNELLDLTNQFVKFYERLVQQSKFGDEYLSLIKKR